MGSNGPGCLADGWKSVKRVYEWGDGRGVGGDCAVEHKQQLAAAAHSPAHNWARSASLFWSARA